MPPKPVYWYFRLLLVSHLVILGAFYLVAGCYIATKNLSNSSLVDLSGRPFGADYLPYWAASRLALNGKAAAIYSRAELYAVEQEAIGAEIQPKIWPYPPTFLLLVLPLGLLPYAISFVGWMAATGAGFGWVIRRLLPGSSLSWLALVFPGTVANLLYGQNGFLSAAFLGGGLLLAERYPFAGGCLLGLLSFKPQLAWLIPLALAAGRYWKTLSGAVISALTLALASYAVLGSQVWIAFYRDLPFIADMVNRAHLWVKMPTVYAAARLQGASPDLAAALQAMTAIGVILVVGWLWHRRLPLPLRGSVLAVGIFLTTPYAVDYDLTILALPFAWLGWEAYAQRSKFQEVYLLLAWTLLAWTVLRPPWMGPGVSTLPFRPAVLVALLLLVLYRAVRPWSDSSG